MAQPSNQSIIDKFLSEYLVEGVEKPKVLQASQKQMKGWTGSDVGALYDSYYKDLIKHLEDGVNPQECIEAIYNDEGWGIEVNHEG